jgi:hypothetical protein
MKNTNILSEKTWLNDDLILSTKKPFSEIINNFKNITYQPHFINKSLWWKAGLLIICTITISILLKTTTPKTNIKDNNNPVLINKIDSIEKNKKDTLKLPVLFDGKQLKNERNNVREESLIQPIKRLFTGTLEMKNELKTDTAEIIKINSGKYDDTIRKAISHCNQKLITHVFESKNEPFGLNLIIENGLYGLIDISNKVIVKPLYDKIFKFGDYQFSWALVERDGLYGFISINGSEIVKPKYDEICGFGDYQFSWALVEKNGLYGFISINGSEIIEPKYDKIFKFGDYQFSWALVEKDGLFGFISINGSEIVEPKYDKIFKFGDYQFNWALVEKDGLYGFISINGSEIIKPQFDKIYKFGEKKLFSAVVQKNGLYGLISINGSIVIEPKYQSIDELFSNKK